MRVKVLLFALSFGSGLDQDSPSEREIRTIPAAHLQVWDIGVFLEVPQLPS